MWVLLAGYWLAAAYAIAGVVCLLSRFVREYGGASFRMAPYMLWPFGATVTTRAVRTFYEGFSTFFWFVACSWWLTALHYVCGALLYVTVIGRPLGLACFRLAPVAFHGPAGRHVAWTWETGADVEVPWS